MVSRLGVPGVSEEPEKTFVDAGEGWVGGIARVGGESMAREGEMDTRVKDEPLANGERGGGGVFLRTARYL